MGFLCSVISEILIVKKGEGESVMRIYYVLDTKCIQICNECIRHKMYLNIQWIYQAQNVFKYIINVIDKCIQIYNECNRQMYLNI